MEHLEEMGKFLNVQSPKTVSERNRIYKQADY